MQGRAASRIDIARGRAAATKQVLAVGAAGVCGLLVLFFRSGGAATAGTSPGATVLTSTEFSDDASLGGGAIAQPSDSSGFPQAQTRTS